VGLHLGEDECYYISRYETEEKQGVQLTITVEGYDADRIQQRWELIQFVLQKLKDIMAKFMPAEKEPSEHIPCPLCHKMHIPFEKIGTSYRCTHAGHLMPKYYYSDLLPVQKSGKCYIYECIMYRLKTD